MWRSQNFNASGTQMALSSSVSARNFFDMSYLFENPLFASYPCVTNPLFDEVSMHFCESIAEYGCDAPLDNGPHESSLLQGSPDRSLESCPVLAICSVVRKQETYCLCDLIKDISEKPQSMESIENPLFAKFPCVTNPLFDSQDVFEKGIVDDVVGTLEALKLEAHDEEGMPYVTAKFPKAMALKENEEAHIMPKEIGLSEVDNVNNTKLQLHNLVAQPESVLSLNKGTDSVSNIRKKLRHVTLNFFTHYAKGHLKSSAVATVSGDGKGAGYERMQLDTYLKESDNCSLQHSKMNILTEGKGAVGYAVQVKDALGSDSMIYKSLKLFHADLDGHTEFSRQFECGNESVTDHKDIGGKGFQQNQLTPYMLELLTIEPGPPLEKHGEDEMKATLQNFMILVRDENFSFKSLKRFRSSGCLLPFVPFIALID